MKKLLARIVLEVRHWHWLVTKLPFIIYEFNKREKRFAKMVTMSHADWESKYFTALEMQCKETGALAMSKEFVAILDNLRQTCGFPFVVTSAYRHHSHSIERKKTRAGSHALGVAVDIKANSSQKATILEEAKKLGITRFGIHDTFIHLDIADWDYDRFPSNVIWAY